MDTRSLCVNEMAEKLESVIIPCHRFATGMALRIPGGMKALT